MFTCVLSGFWVDSKRLHTNPYNFAIMQRLLRRSNYNVQTLLELGVPVGSYDSKLRSLWSDLSLATTLALHFEKSLTRGSTVTKKPALRPSQINILHGL